MSKHRATIRTRLRRLLDRALRRPPAVTLGEGGPVIGRVVEFGSDELGLHATVDLGTRRGARVREVIAGPVPPMSFALRDPVDEEHLWAGIPVEVDPTLAPDPGWEFRVATSAAPGSQDGAQIIENVRLARITLDPRGLGHVSPVDPTLARVRALAEYAQTRRLVDGVPAGEEEFAREQFRLAGAEHSTRFTTWLAFRAGIRAAALWAERP